MPRWKYRVFKNVNNVRLVNHVDYMAKVIGETMRKVEELEWCHLKVNDVTLVLEEDALGTDVVGKAEFTNGFVASIQWVDIIQSTVQQVWRYDRVTNTTTVEVRGNMRMHAVTIGFDVLATLASGAERYTATFTHPLLQFDFTVIRDMFTNILSVTVFGRVPRTTNAMRFLPNTHTSQVIAALYDWNSTTVGITSWGSEVFQPIAYKLITTEIEFPKICYNCPVS
ncbi:uncharacterized protein [Epargyreus clarus]|uniref:uncharacterized protein n=1 Tax=Epargyreus clarus TaxID=520877 RepID=UPI003C2EC006